MSPVSAPERKLNGIAFFIADLQMGLGPLLAVYLVAVLNWNPAEVGLMITAGAIVTLLLQVPMGALVDVTRRKRTLIVGAAVLLSVSTVIVPLAPSLATILANTLILGAVAAFFGPAMASLVLGVVGSARYDLVFARTQIYQHSGTVFYAGILLLIAIFSPLSSSEQAIAPFYLLPLLGVGLIVWVCRLPEKAINHAWARGSDSEGVKNPAVSAFQLVTLYPMIWKLALCFFLFHLGNAAMLFLISERLASSHHGGSASDAILVASGSIVAAQAMMVAMAIWVVAKVNQRGRKFFLLVAFAVLPIRGFLLSLDDSIAYMFTVQLLDGIGAGLIGAVMPIVLADVVRGSGHYNLALGFLLTAQGVGAAMSQTLGGTAANMMGFDNAFLLLAAIALVALCAVITLVPETGTSIKASSRGGE
ncbi:putative MFS-type transporter [BD1-7 clade bacterium]|uniref:Putative MFS-type transporter n=1 Tax=BD1-7 clade bacterium TaxID=2029982 RepID=A0A5S9PWP5_9GAMM|nr:putative MFS-type transporter [BD1-7 clade bacterium]CAA0109415.1 putative MFS-type transporter [BD1-7 clade bacterium]